LIKITIVGVIAFYLFLSGSEPADSMDYTGISEIKKDSSKVLKEIYREVKELGKFPSENFIKRQFFLGEDDDDTNKDIHVFILIQNIDEKEKITIQATYMRRGKNKPVVAYAKNVRSISCVLEGDKIDIIKSDYDEMERESFLPEVLRSIRNKKKLLKMLDKKRTPLELEDARKRVAGLKKLP